MIHCPSFACAWMLTHTPTDCAVQCSANRTDPVSLVMYLAFCLNAQFNRMFNILIMHVSSLYYFYTLSLTWHVLHTPPPGLSQWLVHITSVCTAPACWLRERHWVRERKRSGGLLLALTTGARTACILLWLVVTWLHWLPW